MCAARPVHEKTVGIADAVHPRPPPEFAHRHVVPAEAALGVDRHGVRPAAFGVDAETVLVGVVAEQPVMVVIRQVAELMAVVE